MDVAFAAGKFGTALSILASHPDRIQERLRTAYGEALSRVPRGDIPTKLLPQYDAIMQSLAWVESDAPLPSDDEAGLLMGAIEDLTALLDDELCSPE